jgi:hypothetical protein
VLKYALELAGWCRQIKLRQIKLRQIKLRQIKLRQIKLHAGHALEQGTADSRKDQTHLNCTYSGANGEKILRLHR